MLFLIVAKDRPDSVALRQATREAHLAFLRTGAVEVKLGGPLLSDAADPQSIGSMLLVEAADRAAVEAWAAQDPYAKAGLFDSVDILPWRAVLGDWKPDQL